MLALMRHGRRVSVAGSSWPAACSSRRWRVAVIVCAPLILKGYESGTRKRLYRLVSLLFVGVGLGGLAP